MERLLAVPDVTDPLGMRDRAMLELFYSTGIRRTELCRLELPDLNTERRTLHVRLGKGKKDRMVPVGARAIAWLERYLQEVRPRLCLDTRTQALFLTGYGGPFNPDVVSPHGGRLAGQGRAETQGLLPRPAAHLRHAHAGKRGGHPVHPAVAWPRETRHHGHLHRGQHQTASGGSRPLPSVGPKPQNEASIAAGKQCSLKRGRKSSQLLFSFSAAPVSRWPPPRCRPPPAKLASGVFAVRIGSDFIGDAVAAQCSRRVRGGVVTKPCRVGMNGQIETPSGKRAG